ncbi:MAG: alpha-glucan family phosphorylase [Chloroflexi bacterium]|nr:alpha-glucan family phosphorylase [Chloroflexota bacterium]
MEQKNVVTESPPVLPERIARLGELAYNLWWSWHTEARDLFRALDYPLWRMTGHNPVKQLREISPDRLQAAVNDPAFLALYDSVMSKFDADLSGSQTWFARNYPNRLPGPIAYFSAEFAIHNSLPIYAGGLGVLSGDSCKEANDLGLPLVGVGFMYPQGYFEQQVSNDGWQVEIYRQLDFREAPVRPVLSPDGRLLTVQVQLGGRSLYVGVWLVRVGRVNLYLLDTGIPLNTPVDQQLSARLYIADQELRLQQEMMLGIGGVRVLRALGIAPSIWHANEGHTAFMMLERAREKVEAGASFSESLELVRSETVFTTHTPVPAGHDVFPVHLMDKYFANYWSLLNIDRETFLRLGQHDGPAGQGFNMTILSLRTSGHRNAVSRIHGTVSRRMWHTLWPEAKEEEVPITHITNGVHLPTWIAPEMSQLFEKYLGRDWIEKHDAPGLWAGVLDIPDTEFWALRLRLKRQMMSVILRHAQKRWASGEITAQQALVMGALLDPDALTIGFVRRFAEYKRPGLLFHDIERLKRLVKNPWRPVQIIFAGKSHPADFPSKYLIHRSCTLAADRELEGRVAFVEDYDIHLARYLTQGVDIWLNNPRRLQEACGSSGMKAALNGIPHLSVRDGWWAEAHNGSNGWRIGGSREIPDPAEEDRQDAEALYRLLENEIVPMYYDRDRSGVPHRWIQLSKETIRSITPAFCTRRMLKQYVQQFYLAAVSAKTMR